MITPWQGALRQDLKKDLDRRLSWCVIPCDHDLAGDTRSARSCWPFLTRFQKQFNPFNTSNPLLQPDQPGSFGLSVPCGHPADRTDGAEHCWALAA